MFIKSGKADFLQDHSNSYRDHRGGILQCRKMSLGFIPSTESMGKWDFMTRDQGEGQWMEKYLGKNQKNQGSC